MGHKDLLRIQPIVKEARRLNELYNWGFIFKWDMGSFETRIDINEHTGVCYLGDGNKPLYDFTMVCPDILEFYHHFVIEFEEEATPNKKGHFEGNKRDVKRDRLYQAASFDLLKIWESDKDWKNTLKSFLLKQYLKRFP